MTIEENDEINEHMKFLVFEITQSYCKPYVVHDDKYYKTDDILNLTVESIGEKND